MTYTVISHNTGRTLGLIQAPTKGNALCIARDTHGPLAGVAKIGTSGFASACRK